MTPRPYIPLLVKVLGWLLLHLIVLGLVFFAFMTWQLGLGLDSLLSGSAGDRLRAFGDTAREELSVLPESRWDDAVHALGAERGVTAALVNPGKRDAFPNGIPFNIQERLKASLPPLPPIRPSLLGPAPEGRRTSPLGDLENGGGHEPPPIPDGPVRRMSAPLSRPVFLLRGEGGDGYWAGIHLVLQPDSRQPPRPQMLLIRADGLDGSGMFFEFRPWLWGGLAVLALSLAFWAPFIWSITRYIGRLTVATKRIAAGQFKISLPRPGNDELGNLGVAIESMADRLDHLVTGQKRFLGDAAHELCAPLARLRTGLGILEMKLNPADQIHLEAIETDAQELATLVEEILAFSRVGSRPPRKRKVALESLIHEVILRERSHRPPEIHIPPGLIVFADPDLLGRALGNLLRNASIHAGPSAHVTLSACVGEESGSQGKRIEIRVSDDGPGVPPEELPHLFEPFYRPDRSRSRETGGSGLGLAIVRTAVESCDGEVSAAIAPEGGLMVTLRLSGESPPNANDPG